MTEIKDRFGWRVLSQHPDVASPQLKAYAEAHWLPVLLKIARDVCIKTGYQWKITSYWRKSPSHVKGCALDIAPCISPRSSRFYAVSHLSDPVLYKRERLLRQLQGLCGPNGTKFDIALVLEPDHIHIHMGPPEQGGGGHTKLFKWGVLKPVYSDSARRGKLPLITSATARQLAQRY